mgnify:FL=1
MPESAHVIPRLDLQSVYGAGPELQPYLFDETKNFGRTHFKLDEKKLCPPAAVCKSPSYRMYDMRRTNPVVESQTANQETTTTRVPLIADVRNDEHILLSQLHVAFQRFHNKTMDHLINSSPEGKELQQQTDAFYASSKKNVASVYLPLYMLPESRHSYAPDVEYPSLEKQLDRLNEFKKEKVEELNAMVQRSSLTLSQEATAVSSDNFAYWVVNIKDGIDQNNDVQAQDTSTIQAFEETIFRPFQALNNSIRNHITRKWADYLHEARKKLTWHYHYLILHDFLPRIIDMDTLRAIIPDFSPLVIHRKTKPNLRVYSFDNEPFLPVEFSTAFFRFGHSLVQDGYQFHECDASRAVLFPIKKINQPLQKAMDWSLFFPDSKEQGTGKNPARKISVYLSPSMIQELGIQSNQDGPLSSTNIFYRNLERGRRENLPSGQDIAQWMVRKGIIRPDNLEKNHPGKEQLTNELIDYFKDEDEESPTLSSKDIRAFCENPPLWFYTLMEAHLCGKGEKLGPVAGRIVAEVFIGIIAAHPDSLFSFSEPWVPEKLTRTEEPYTMSDFLREAGVYDLQEAS